LSWSKPFEGNLSDQEEVPEHLIRNFRPPHLEFRIGTVVLIQTMITGVIVGWEIDMTVSLILKYPSPKQKLTSKIV